jgi:hypothetical protein
VTSAATLALGENATAKLRDAARVILWGLVLYGGVALVGSRLTTRSVGALAVQMVLAEWGAGRLGVAWSDPTADIPKLGAIAARGALGAALGIVAATLVVLVALGTHGLSGRANAPVPSELGIALFTACLASARDELLLRGVTLRAFRQTCPLWLVLLVCGGAGAAAEYGALSAAGNVQGVHLAVAGLLAIVFASLWTIDRGGWLAFGAHAAWTFATGGFIRGGLLDLRSSAGAWGGGDAGLSGSLVLAATVLPLTLTAFTLTMRWSTRAQKG